MSSPAPPDNAKTRFSNRVEAYVRYRPGYPPELLDCLTREFGLQPAHRIADLGSGTGISAELFLRHGNAVCGVEPNADMRAAAEKLLVKYANFQSVSGAAEATTLPPQSVDWVVAGQAFHWFDAARAREEARRILRPGGQVALFWNVRLEHTPFLQAYEQLLCEFSIDYQQVRHQEAEPEGRIGQFFGATPFVRRGFANRQIFDLDGLKGRTLSASYTPPPEHPRHAAMAAELVRLFERFQENGAVAFEYETRLYVGRPN